MPLPHNRETRSANHFLSDHSEQKKSGTANNDPKRLGCFLRKRRCGPIRGALSPQFVASGALLLQLACAGSQAASALLGD